jgi:formylglycine-generating enzyme required for sulfatase activity
LLIVGGVAYAWSAKRLLSGGAGAGTTGVSVVSRPEAAPSWESTVWPEAPEMPEGLFTESTATGTESQATAASGVGEEGAAGAAAEGGRPSVRGGGRGVAPGRAGQGPEPAVVVHVTEMTWDKDGAAMVKVAGGTFTMGSAGGDESERPAHRVTIGGCWIDKTEVTNEQYARFVEATGRAVPYVAEAWASAQNWDRKAHTYPDGRGTDPVTLVSWEDAVAYAKWAGKRLPTEAEWEFAARGGSGSVYPWGNAWNASLCNSAEADPFALIAPVGSFVRGASWCGALDLAGNVWEWCADWFSPTYYAESPSADPTGPSAGRYRVVRGGSWGSGPEPCRATFRGFRPPEAKSDGAGFRCVADAG